MRPVNHPFTRVAGPVRAAVILLPMLAAWAPAAAQTCFRGRPLGSCRSFFLTEFGVRWTFTGNSTPYGSGTRQAAFVHGGWMWNVGPRSAAGGVVGVDTDHEFSDAWFAVGPRFRFWFRNTSIDTQATVAIHNGSVRNPTLQVIWMYRDAVGLDAGIVFGDTYDRAGTRPFLGVRVGSYPGVAVIAAGVGIALVFAAACSDGCLY